MKLSPSRVATLLLVPALALTGCGGDDKVSDAPPPTASAPASSPAPAPNASSTPGAPSQPAVPGQPGTSGAPAAPTPKAVSDFAACMRRNGITLPPAGQSMPPNTDKAKVEAAVRACIKHMTATPQVPN